MTQPLCNDHLSCYRGLLETLVVLQAKYGQTIALSTLIAATADAMAYADVGDNNSLMLKLFRESYLSSLAQHTSSKGAKIQ